MRRTLATLLLAICAAGLWVLVEIEREHTDIRAPWTGITTVAAALAFVAVGVVGRGWRALLTAAGAAIAGVYLSPLIVYGHGRWSYEEPDVSSSCDPAASLSRPSPSRPPSRPCSSPRPESPAAASRCA